MTAIGNAFLDLMENLRSLESAVEDVIRSSEVRAVARLIHSGTPVRVGQVVDYFIDTDTDPPRSTFGKFTNERKSQPYRVAIEQWHLNAAEKMLLHAHPK